MTQLLDWFEGSEQPRQMPCEASPETLSNVDVVLAIQDRPLFSTLGAVRSNRTMWISGPITTVHDEHICHVMAAVARVGLETVGLEIERGLSEKGRSAAGGSRKSSNMRCTIYPYSLGGAGQWPEQLHSRINLPSFSIEQNMAWKKSQLPLIRRRQRLNSHEKKTTHTHASL